jgi:hypothetical protein
MTADTFRRNRRIGRGGAGPHDNPVSPEPRRPCLMAITTSPPGALRAILPPYPGPLCYLQMVGCAGGNRVAGRGVGACQHRFGVALGRQGVSRWVRINNHLLILLLTLSTVSACSPWPRVSLGPGVYGGEQAFG